jgi:O-antigen/teichoic acid export membrane protein
MNLLKNSTIVIIGVVVSNLLAYLFHFLAGRMLGPEEYGEFGALMSLYLLVALPAGALSFGVTKYTAVFNSANEFKKIALLRKKIQDNVLIFSAFVLLFTIIFSRIIANFLKITSVVPIIIVGITLVFALLYPINMGVLQGMKKFRQFSLNSIAESFSRVVLLSFFLWLGYGVNGAILAYGLAYFIAFLLVFLYIKEVRKEEARGDELEARAIYRFIVQVLFVNIILQVILNVPSLIIKHFYSSEFTGYWTAALNIARISLFVSVAIAQVMFPEIAGEKDQLVKKKIFRNAVLLVLLASSVIAIIFLVIPRIFIQILYGRAYTSAIPILQWLGFVMILFGLLQLWANYLMARIE